MREGRHYAGKRDLTSARAKTRAAVVSGLLAFFLRSCSFQFSSPTWAAVGDFDHGLHAVLSLHAWAFIKVESLS